MQVRRAPLYILCVYARMFIMYVNIVVQLDYVCSIMLLFHGIFLREEMMTNNNKTSCTNKLDSVLMHFECEEKWRLYGSGVCHLFLNRKCL